MKKQGMILTCAALALAISMGLGYAQTNASASAEQEVSEVVTQYLNALNDGDVTKAAQYVMDYRFRTQDELEDGYKELLKSDPITNAKVLAVSAQGRDRATVTIGFTSHNAGDLEQSLVVEKKDGDWKVMLEQTPMVKGKSDK